jgi:transmembrane sensor
MDEVNARISELIIKYLRGEMSEEEDKELQDWVMLSRENYELVDSLKDPDRLEEEIREFHQSKINIRRKIDAKISEAQITSALSAEGIAAKVVRMPGTRHRSLRRGIGKYVAAACILLLLSGAAWWQIRRSSGAGITGSGNAGLALKNDAGPGGDKATLVLSDGSSILLDTAANGKLADQGAARITKGKGQLAYNLQGTSGVSSGTATEKSPETSPVLADPARMGYNTLTTPKAGQYMVVLSDNTKVWLNNASSLRYLTSFNPGKERLVELSGEAYFEVAKDVTRPFRVRANGLTVDVLATSFNIMAYADEHTIRATLLEGKVKLSSGDKEGLLKPGEQAAVSAPGKWEVLKDIDTDGVIAWKNGYFHFDHAALPAVMRQLARWYDVEVEFRGAVPEHFFGGSIYRGLKLSQVLENLQQDGVHFSIEGKKLVVTP